MIGQCNDQLFEKIEDLEFSSPFNYDAPNPLPAANSPVLTGADFSGTVFGDAWFNKVTYRGALGNDSWLPGWTNFTPLKTNYNFPK